MRQLISMKRKVVITALLVLFGMQTPHAKTLTIGKGSGEVWRGDPFSAHVNLALSGREDISTIAGAAAITNSTSECIPSTDLITIGNSDAIRIAPGVGLVPIADFSVSTIYNGRSVSMIGTIGMNGTQGLMTDGRNGAAPPNRAWCLNFVDINPATQQALNISGMWAIVTDGSQQTGMYTIPPMHASSSVLLQTKIASILTYTQLRVTSIACSIATTTNVNFGTAARDITPFAELANFTAPLTVTCDQDEPDTIDTNINVQFSGKVFGGNTSRLALNEDGGYITGEIGNGVTGSGTCDASTGVQFNSTDINVGVLGASTLNQTYANQITWRLCSGGNNLPTGPVTASANVAVTYN